MAKLLSHKAETIALEEEIFERKKKDMAALKKESGELLLPDFSRTARQVLEDAQYRGIIARAVGKDFSEREFISEKDLQNLMMLREINERLPREVEIKLIPIMKHGRKWEDGDSRTLRKHYMQKSGRLFEILSKFRFEGVTKSEEIFLNGSGIFDKTSAYLDFSSAAALVDKGPRKRKTTRASGSVYFSEVYVNGERGAEFALFDGFDDRGREYLPSSIAAGMFRENARAVGKKEEILSFLEAFARSADARISESVKGFSGSSATCGIILGRTLYYVNIGNNRMYGIARSGEIRRIAGEDIGAAGSDLEKLYTELRYPYLYLGGFTQRMKGKRTFRMIHSNFSLRPPHIGTLDLSEFSSVFVASSGIWKSAISIKDGRLGGEEARFAEIFARAKNALSAVERLNLSVKNSMREANYASLVDDIAMLYFTV